MTNEKKEILKLEAKELIKKLNEINDDDKSVILASIKGMLLVADVNKEEGTA